MRDYRASGKLSLPGLIIGLVVGVVLAIIVGFISAAAQIFNIYLIPLNALLIAVLAGVIGGFFVKFARVRNWLMAVLLGGVLGVVIYAASWGGQYAYTAYELSQDYAGKDADLVENWLLGRQDLDLLLRRQVGADGLAGYIQYMAEGGMSISRVGSSSTGGIDLDRNATLVYYVIEVVLAVLGGLIGAAGMVVQPYDESKNRWVGIKDMRFFGSMDAGQVSSFKSNLEMGGYQAAGALMSQQTGAVKVWGYRMGDLPTDDVLIRIDEPSGKQTKTTHGVVTASEFQILVNAAQQVRSAPAMGNMSSPFGTSNF